MSNTLTKLEKYIKRPVLAKLVGTNETYLCVLAKKRELTEDMEQRLEKAADKIIKKLSEITNE